HTAPWSRIANRNSFIVRWFPVSCFRDYFRAWTREWCGRDRAALRQHLGSGFSLLEERHLDVADRDRPGFARHVFPAETVAVNNQARNRTAHTARTRARCHPGAGETKSATSGD